MLGDDVAEIGFGAAVLLKAAGNLQKYLGEVVLGWFETLVRLKGRRIGGRIRGLRGGVDGRMNSEDGDKQDAPVTNS